MSEGYKNEEYNETGKLNLIAVISFTVERQRPKIVKRFFIQVRNLAC